MHFELATPHNRLLSTLKYRLQMGAPPVPNQSVEPCSEISYVESIHIGQRNCCDGSERDPRRVQHLQTQLQPAHGELHVCLLDVLDDAGQELAALAQQHGVGAQRRVVAVVVAFAPCHALVIFDVVVMGLRRG